VSNFIYAQENDTLFFSQYYLTRYHNNDKNQVYCIEYNKEDKKINAGSLYRNTVFTGTQNGIEKFIKMMQMFGRRRLIHYCINI